MTKKMPTTKAGKKAKMEKVMKEYKAGKLKSGSKTGPKVRSRDQAIAIGLSSSGQGKGKVAPRKLGGTKPMKKSK